jgi:hypothetical protein
MPKERERPVHQVSHLGYELLDEFVQVGDRCFSDTAETAGRLGALLDLPVEDWQDLELYRAWVNAIRDAEARRAAEPTPSRAGT